MYLFCMTLVQGCDVWEGRMAARRPMHENADRFGGSLLVCL